MNKNFYDVFIKVCQEDGNLEFDKDNPNLPDFYKNKEYLNKFNEIPDDEKEYEARELKNMLIKYYIRRDTYDEWKNNTTFHEKPKQIISRQLKILNDFEEFMNSEILDFYLNTDDIYKETPKQSILKFVSEIIKEFELLQNKSNSNGKKKKDIKDFHILQIERYYKNIEYENSQKESFGNYLIQLAKKYNISYTWTTEYILSSI